MERNKVIVKVSVQGIIVNVLLVVMKAFVGLMSHSIAIILDAVNNLSDAITQVITIIGTKLSSKEPDKKHPYGYGRIEYFTDIILAALILTAGGTAIKESIDKIIHPVTANYTIVSLILIVVGVVVKFFFGKYVTLKGEEVSSQALIASGHEASTDAYLSSSTLIAALISMLFHINLEGILGVALSAFIIKAGLEALITTLSSLIGDRADNDLTKEIKMKISEFDNVNGAYDLILHDYGPSRSIGTVHIEVNDRLDAREIHLLTRRIINAIKEEYNIVLTVGIYASNTSDKKTMDMKRKVSEFIQPYDNIIGMHAFFVDFEKKEMLFDLVISFREKDPHKLIDHIKVQVMEAFPGFKCDINIDHDFSD